MASRSVILRRSAPISGLPEIGMFDAQVGNSRLACRASKAQDGSSRPAWLARGASCERLRMTQPFLNSQQRPDLDSFKLSAQSDGRGGTRLDHDRGSILVRPAAMRQRMLARFSMRNGWDVR
jgi:hypothetical protein